MWIFPVKIPSPVNNIQILILEMQMDICEVCNLSMSGCKMSAKMKKLEVPGQIENKSNFLPNQTVQTRKNSIKNKSCYLIWTYRKSVISDAQKIRKIWAKDA